MNTETIMLYVIILLNQAVSYGVLIALAMKGAKQNTRVLQPCMESKPQVPPQKESKGKTSKTAEENGEGKGAYLDYINKFEVNA